MLLRPSIVTLALLLAAVAPASAATTHVTCVFQHDGKDTTVDFSYSHEIAATAGLYYEPYRVNMGGTTYQADYIPSRSELSWSGPFQGHTVHYILHTGTMAIQASGNHGSCRRR